jgi:glucokinase
MPSHNPDDYVIGVDIGGTKVAAGFVNASGEISEVHRVPMVSDRDAAAGFASVISAIDPLIEVAAKNNWKIHSVGVCAPGPLDQKTGVIINPPNVPCWRNYALAAEIAARYHAAVKIENDANAAALAESMWGAGKGHSRVFYMCIGTGVGTGFVLDGRIYHGRSGAAFEGGHVTIDYRGPQCNCGKRGCVEALISGPAIAKRAQAKLQASDAPASQLLDLSNGKIAAVTCEMVNRASLADDAVAKETLLKTLELLAVSLGNTVDLIEPDIIVIGGGVAAMLRPYFAEIRARVPKWCVNSRCSEIPVVPAYYGANSGIAGGAALCS